MPPPPRGPTISYGPRRVSGTSAMGPNFSKDAFHCHNSELDKWGRGAGLCVRHAVVTNYLEARGFPEEYCSSSPHETIKVASPEVFVPRTLTALASLAALIWTLTLLFVSSASAVPQPPSTLLSLMAGAEGWDSPGPDPAERCRRRLGTQRGIAGKVADRWSIQPGLRQGSELRLPDRTPP